MTYRIIEGIPSQNILETLVTTYAALFEDARLDFFRDRIHTKTDLSVALCYDQTTLVGFKLGYRYNAHTFYSWVGGVLPSYRKRGIAQQLMELQHKAATQKGYQKIRTKSMNRFKPMMSLNLKNGFDIVSVYTNDSQQAKIVFEKNLLNH